MSGVAGEVKVVFSADTASYTASVKKAKEQLGVFEKSAGSAGAAARREMNEARGSVMVLGEEIGIHLPRHVQKFVAGLPGVASAMSAAFDTIAVFAIGAAVVEAGKKIYEFVEKNEDAARRNAAAWRDIEGPMQQTNDELQLANDKIENAIAKLEHKPQNAMKEAIDEAIVSADTLGTKLQQDAARIADTLDKQQVPWYQQAIGFAGSGDVTKRAKSLQDNLNEIDVGGHAKLNSMRDQGATEEQFAAATADLNAKRKAVIDAELKWAVDELAAARKKQDTFTLMGRTDQSARISLLAGYSANLGRGSDFIAGTQQNNSDMARQKQLQAAKDLADESREADAHRVEVAKQGLDAMRADHDVSFAEEVAYWQKLADTAKRGSMLYNSALDEANKARAADWKQFQAGLFSGMIDDVEHHDRENPNLQMPSTDAVGEAWLADQKMAEEAADRFKENAVKAFKDTADAIKATEKQEEESIQLLLRRGMISAHQAAMQAQAVHAESFSSWSQASGALAVKFPEMPTPEGAATMGGYQSQAEKDRAEVEATSTLGEFTDRLRQTADEFTNLGNVLGNFTIHTLDGFNQTLMRELSSPANMLRGKHEWRNMGAGVAEGAGTSALQFGEGSIMKALGLGPKKGDGYHTWVDNLPGGAGVGGGATGVISGVGGFFAKLFGGGSLASSTLSAAKGVTADAAGLATQSLDLGLLPGFAGGGMIPSNMPVLVGEDGPEILAGASGHTVIPNDVLGGGGVHIYNDNRGATDPAAINAAVDRGMARHLPNIRNIAQSVISDHNRRSPSSRRI